uniref:Growth hormone-regulated TBC protein 1 n=1 Tax=Phallusia mammillata TaxID=59560 RepID=A0A6F9DET7_9ASCI|nr:growth hormone-regulated TBC protein 1-A-like [Phallusia mammillata]
MAGTSKTSNGRTTGATIGTLSKIDAYGFKRGEDFDYKSYENFESEYLAVLARRMKRWNEKVLDNGQAKSVKHRRMVKRFCRKGIPERHRPMVWMDVSGARKKMQKEPEKYQKLLSSDPDTLEDRLVQDAINTDLDRTFPDNIHFQVATAENQKKQLNNILIAYGRHRPEIGYCQGMNYITALLLIVVKDEEKCFWLLSVLIDTILPQYYSKMMTALRAELNVLTEIVGTKYPNIQRVMDSEGIPWMLVASKWFICLYIDILPIETVLRIWDCLFYEGSKVLFRVALFLIKDKETVIKECNGMPDIIESFKNLKTDDRALECHQFIHDCFIETNPLPKAEIKKLRTKHVALVEEEDRKLAAKREAR